MTTHIIDPAQRTAAKVAGFSGLFAAAIVVFANYALLNPICLVRRLCQTPDSKARRLE